MFAVKAKIYGVLYNQASSIAFDETSSYWSALKRYVYFQRTHTYTNGKKIIILSFMTAEAKYITAQKVFKVGSFNKLIASVEMFSLLSMKISN